DAFHSHTRLGDIGRDHDPATRTGGEGSVLFRSRQRAVKWQNVDTSETAERADRGADFPRPGEEDEDIPRVAFERMTHRVGDTVLQAGVRSLRLPLEID